MTRPRQQAHSLADWLMAAGAEVASYPLIRIGGPSDEAPLADALSRLAEFDWAIFTSANAFHEVWTRLTPAGRIELARLRLACVGAATAATLRANGLEPAAMPADYVGDEVPAAIAAVEALAGLRILWPRAASARRQLADRLRERGALLLDVEAYATLPDDAGAAALRAAISRGDIDVVTLTSSSAARSYAAALGADAGSVRIAVIGPVTAATVKNLRLPVHVESSEHTVSGLVASLCVYYSGGGRLNLPIIDSNFPEI